MGEVPSEVRAPSCKALTRSPSPMRGGLGRGLAASPNPSVVMAGARDAWRPTYESPGHPFDGPANAELMYGSPSQLKLGRHASHVPGMIPVGGARLAMEPPPSLTVPWPWQMPSPGTAFSPARGENRCGALCLWPPPPPPFRRSPPPFHGGGLAAHQPLGADRIDPRFADHGDFN